MITISDYDGIGNENTFINKLNTDMETIEDAINEIDPDVAEPEQNGKVDNKTQAEIDAFGGSYFGTTSVIMWNTDTLALNLYDVSSGLIYIIAATPA